MGWEAVGVIGRVRIYSTNTYFLFCDLISFQALGLLPDWLMASPRALGLSSTTYRVLPEYAYTGSWLQHGRIAVSANTMYTYQCACSGHQPDME
jgi:hypothetical protein